MKRCMNLVGAFVVLSNVMCLDCTVHMTAKEECHRSPSDSRDKPVTSEPPSDSRTDRKSGSTVHMTAKEECYRSPPYNREVVEGLPPRGQ